FSGHGADETRGVKDAGPPGTGEPRSTCRHTTPSTRPAAHGHTHDRAAGPRQRVLIGLDSPLSSSGLAAQYVISEARSHRARLAQTGSCRNHSRDLFV